MSLNRSSSGLAVAGLVITAVVATWWLGTVGLALPSSGNPERASAQAILALVLLRGLLLPAFGLPAGLRLARATWPGLLTMVAVAWPVVALAWSASEVTLQAVLAAEGVLLALAVVIGALGTALAPLTRGRLSADASDNMATAAGLLVALGLWVTRQHWIPAGLS